MANCGLLLKSVLVTIVLVAVIHSGFASEKLANCCKKVNSQELTEPITGYMPQRANPPCVRAIIFQTETGLYCSQVTAPWVRRKIVQFERAKAQATQSSPSSTASLLSIITSTASPPSSSTLPLSTSPLPSFPSTSQMPTGETFPEE